MEYSTGGEKQPTSHTYAQNLEAYLNRYGDPLSVDMAKDFYRKNRPIERYGVLIPIAAHQESTIIERALHEYALQQGAQPFTIFLSLNYPRTADTRLVADSVRSVERAIEDNPQLDIRYTTLSYEHPTIGQIRKDLWDSVARVVQKDGVYGAADAEFVGISHDIDTERISPHYIRNLQDHYHYMRTDGATQPLPALLTQVKHAYPFDTHPNIARAILWKDALYRNHHPNGNFEEGTVIPLQTYIQHGGFRPNDALHEMHFLGGKTTPPGIPGTSMDTSPRRYITDIASHGYEVWSEETFGPTDVCREKLANDDLSSEQLRTLVMANHEKDLEAFYYKKFVDSLMSIALDYHTLSAVDPKQASENLTQSVREIITPRIKIAHRLLERIIGETVLTTADKDALVEKKIHEHTEQIKHMFQ